MMRKRIASLMVVSLMLTAWAIPYTNRVNLHGGEFPTKAMSLWQLEKYKYTDLLTREPLCWCPFKSYVEVDKHVKITNKNNYNALIIDADLIALTYEHASYNKAHAIKYKGKPKTRLKKIYRYCRNTQYVIHVKYAKDVFEKRQGDCAGIASAFYVLCRKNKIPCRYVIGWTDGECHAWNQVKINGKWYWVDATLGKWISRKQFKGRTVMEIW